MHPTKNDLPEVVRAKIVELLNVRLAEAIDLQLRCKQAHWNVKGPQFIALHELFDRVGTAISTHVDDLAERATALGGRAEGTLAAVAKHSTFSEYPLALTDGTAHIEAL